MPENKLLTEILSLFEYLANPDKPRNPYIFEASIRRLQEILHHLLGKYEIVLKPRDENRKGNS